MNWIKDLFESLDTESAGIGKGGHHLLTPQEKVILNRFLEHKHNFTGTETANIDIPGDFKVKQEAASKILQGVLTIKP